VKGEGEEGSFGSDGLVCVAEDLGQDGEDRLDRYCLDSIETALEGVSTAWEGGDARDSRDELV
jgi:hypothetical protein